MRGILGTALVVAAALASVGGQGAALDLIVRGGRIVDGTGNPSFDADLGIRDGRVVALGRVAAPASRTIDATGLVVAPGFIDIHNHSDTTLLDDADGQSMLRQGVTSMIFGEGGSAAPSRRWPRFRAYFDELRRRGLTANVGSYVGASQVWTEVRGPRAGPPDGTELEAMRRLVGEAMSDGALGLASSLSGPPGVWIDTGTLVAMAEVAGQHGGIYSTHIRTEGTGVFKAVEEAIEIGRRGRLPVDIIHLKIAERTMWGRMPDLVALIVAARARGQAVEANVYPYRAGQNDLASIVPPWAHEGGAPALIERLRDPSLRQRLEGEILGRVPLGDLVQPLHGDGRLGWHAPRDAFESALSPVRREADERGHHVHRHASSRRAVRAARRERRVSADGLLPSQRGGHAARARATVRVDRIGRQRRERGRARWDPPTRIRASTGRFRACSAATCGRPGC